MTPIWPRLGESKPIQLRDIRHPLLEDPPNGANGQPIDLDALDQCVRDALREHSLAQNAIRKSDLHKRLVKFMRLKAHGRKTRDIIATCGRPVRKHSAWRSPTGLKSLVENDKREDAYLAYWINWQLRAQPGPINSLDDATNALWVGYDPNGELVTPEEVVGQLNEAGTDALKRLIARYGGRKGPPKNEVLDFLIWQVADVFEAHVGRAGHRCEVTDYSKATRFWTWVHYAVTRLPNDVQAAHGCELVGRDVCDDEDAETDQRRTVETNRLSARVVRVLGRRRATLKDRRNRLNRHAPNRNVAQPPDTCPNQSGDDSHVPNWTKITDP